MLSTSTHVLPVTLGNHVHIDSHNVSFSADDLGPDTTSSFDVSSCPDSISSRESATSQETAIGRVDELIALSNIVKLSDEDLAWLRPWDRRGDAIRWLMSRGPSLLVVTHGNTGATAFSRTGSVSVRGRRVDGADAAVWQHDFTSGLLSAMHDRDLLGHRSDTRLRTVGLDTLREILLHANRSAGLTVFG